MQQLFHVSPQQCDGLVKGPCSGHLYLPYPSLHVSVWWLLWCNNRDGTAAHTAKICACACVHSLCKVFTCSWLVPFLFLNIASVFVQGASVVWDWFTPTSRAQCRPSPSRTCPSTSTWLSSGRASLCSSSASSSAVTSSGEQEQSQHDTQLNSFLSPIYWYHYWDFMMKQCRGGSCASVFKHFSVRRRNEAFTFFDKRLHCILLGPIKEFSFFSLYNSKPSDFNDL